MKALVWILFAAVAVVVVAKLLMSRRATSASCIADPRLGILNLSGEQGEALVAEDLAGFGNQFSGVVRSSAETPRCDVLLVYCDIEAGGEVRGRGDNLRAIVRESGARVVVVANEHDGRSYMATAPRDASIRANLVLTLRRNGTALPRFLARLFKLMREGVSMPVAWSRLAPQVRGMTHADSPEAMFVCELGGISFG